jgi:hypothetical protein
MRGRNRLLGRTIATSAFNLSLRLNFSGTTVSSTLENSTFLVLDLGYFRVMANHRDIVSVQRVMRAPASVIFDVLADPRRHPEIDGSGTVMQARPDAPDRLSLGATFAMNMRRVLRYGMINTVTEFDEGRRIAWSPKPANGRGARFFGRIWRYELEPVDEGTLVRETWDISREGLRFFLRYVYASRFRQDMTKSLERLESLAITLP